MQTAPAHPLCANAAAGRAGSRGEFSPLLLAGGVAAAAVVGGLLLDDGVQLSEQVRFMACPCGPARPCAGQLVSFRAFRAFPGQAVAPCGCSGGPPAAVQRSRAGGATEGAATRCPGAAAEARPRPPAQVVGQGGLPGVDLRSAPLDARTKLALQAAVALMAAGGGVFGAPRARAPPRACPSCGGAPA